MMPRTAIRKAGGVKRKRASSYSASSRDISPPIDRNTLSNPIQTYIYDALTGPFRQIRLFELLPGQKHEPLQGTLRTVKLDDKPEYDAVSYVWGDPTPRHELSLDGDKVLPLAENSRNALVAMRLRDRSITLWIDTICINQQHIPERGHQVKLMETIYSSARTVRVWLNVDVDVDAKPFRTVRRLKQVELVDVRTFGCSKKRTVRETVGLEDFPAEFWDPLFTVLNSVYWTRVWIQQEFFLARKLHFHLPRGPLDAAVLLPFEHIVREHAIQRGPIPGSTFLGPPLELSGLFPSLYSGFLGSSGATQPLNAKRKKLLELFLSSSSLRTTDPRDKVYGMLGMASDYDEDDFTPDYTLSLEQVYSSAVMHSIKKHRSLDFLCNYMETGPMPLHCDWLPTWLPAPEKESRLLPGWLRRASGDCHLDVDQVSMGSNHPETLAVRGVLCDTVDVKSPLLMGGSVAEWITSLRDFSSQVERPPEKVIGIILEQFSFLDDRYIDDMSYGFGPIEPGKETPFPYIYRDLASLPEKITNHQATWGYWQIEWRPDVDLNAIGITSWHLRAATALYRMIFDVSLIYTENKQLGLFRASHPGLKAEPGDEIWVLFGCRVPLILRPQPKRPGLGHTQRSYAVVGPALVAGMLDGEMCAHLWPDGKRREPDRGPLPETIYIV